MQTYVWSSIFNIFQPINLMFIILGVGSGIIVGALPGLTATMAIALLVPFTFAMAPTHGLVLLGGIYVGAIYGGCFSAILINTPGTPSAIATTFDGYPMAKKGEAYRAIVAATVSSVIGGLIGVFFLIFLSPPLSRASLKFGPPEFFWLTAFGLTIIATLASKSILKGLIGGAFGLLVSTIGISPIGGSVRFTFGTVSLQGGIGLIPALIGFFCIPEVLGMIERKGKHYNVISYRTQKNIIKNVLLKLLKKPILVLRSAIIGTIVGIIPGAGGNIAGLVSYNEAVRASKHPQKFGRGIIDGVIASETSNNAEVSGSLIPLLTLGIPGAPPAAVLLGALLLQGMRPGADLFTVHASVTYTFIFSLILSNILILPMGIYSGKLVSKLITNIPVAFLAPLVVFLTIIGSFSIHNNIFDVYVMLFFGLIGYVGKKAGFGPGPIVLGIILGKICEQGLVQSILMGKAAGSIFKIFFTRPISLILIFLTITSAGWPLIRKYLGGTKKR
ncbi:MAG: tripartite tricarboxylate transporter permease [Spirochaetes bacterium]|nr:tripartite tricarboxylate transporter permease [Spirochaetota bacterium]